VKQAASLLSVRRFSFSENTERILINLWNWSLHWMLADEFNFYSCYVQYNSCFTWIRLLFICPWSKYLCYYCKIENLFVCRFTFGKFSCKIFSNFSLEFAVILIFTRPWMFVINYPQSNKRDCYFNKLYRDIMNILFYKSSSRKNTCGRFIIMRLFSRMRGSLCKTALLVDWVLGMCQFVWREFPQGCM
jgi:hypothetical protein